VLHGERRIPWPGVSDDAGVTLTELLVALSILTVVMTIFTTGIVQMYRSSNVGDARSTAQQQVSLALLRLDRQVRYAAEIGAPRAVGAGQYVEVLRPATGGRQECLQVRSAGGLLQQRTWAAGVSPAAPTPWSVLASGVTSATPFSLLAPLDTDTIGYQRLRVRLTTTAGGGAASVTKSSDITFTALNSTRDSGTTPCSEGWTLP
jgi:prepilin-type N-terminal cleavage/methylation domain-containing protein